MTAFNILDKTMGQLSGFVLEASAGTGKTFSIEHLVVRSILEGVASIEEILVVTFTKAAAKELKTRIKQNLQKALEHLKTGCREIPYIAAILDMPSNSIQKANKALRLALVDFDRACISTIHSFCFRAVMEHGSEMSFWDLNQQEDEIDSSLKWEKLAHFFRSEILTQEFTSRQLEILLSHLSIIKLAQEAMHLVSKGIKIARPDSNETLRIKFFKVVQSFKNRGWNSSAFLNCMAEEGHIFKSVSEGRTKILKSNILQFFTNLSYAFEGLSIDSLDMDALIEADKLLDLFLPQNLKIRSQISPEMKQYMAFLENEVRPSLLPWSQFSKLFLRLIYFAQAYLAENYEKKGGIDYQLILRKMEELSENSSFKDALNGRYKRVIIDEFQDTDPLQWKIFKNIFPCPSLVLVGDPKQSIYAFRNADIYTYIDASEKLGEQNKYQLQTNFRSSPRFIAALNQFFDPQSAPGCIALPRLKKELPYKPVLPPSGKQDQLFKDEPVIELLLVEEQLKEKELETQFLYPFFAKELIRLNQEKKIPFNRIAFLVKDHTQSNNLAHFLRQHAFPVMQQKSSKDAVGKILEDLIYLLQAIINPRNYSYLQNALCGTFFQMDCRTLLPKELDQLDNSQLARLMALFLRWRKIWIEKGITLCLQAVLNDPLPDSISLDAYILSSADGRRKLFELYQIGEWLGTQERKNRADPEALLRELKSFAAHHQLGNEKLSFRPVPEEEAITIMTMHMSKGLEYEVVFAPGLMKRTPVDADIIPIVKEGEIELDAVDKRDCRYIQFLEEADAEKGRQLYVAMTRAKEKLYIPVVQSRKRPASGKASPIELHLARFGQPFTEWESLYGRLGPLNFDPLYRLSEKGDLIKVVTLKADAPTCFSQKPMPALTLPHPFALSIQTRFSISFTSLTKNIVKPEGLCDLQAPHDFDLLDPSIHTLPAGSTTGELVHQILEAMPWKLLQTAALQSDLIPFVERFTSHSPYQKWNDVIAEMIFRAFNTPFLSGAHALSSIPENKIFREADFLINTQLMRDISECSHLEGEVKGIMDLAFEHDGKYYLLDWKTNWLGPDASFYTPFQVQKAVLSHRYDLQGKIYQNVFIAYLKTLGLTEETFGGIFFVFLRGLKSGQGIYQEIV